MPLMLHCDGDSTDGAISQVWENQRFYGLLFGWCGATHTITPHANNNATASRQSPALLERPPLSDASGQPVTLPDPPDDARHTHTSKGWTVHISPSTDADGWQYASVFKYVAMMLHCGTMYLFPRLHLACLHRHFDYTRPGGRASQRSHDFVRRRQWRREGGDPVVAEVGAPSASSAPTAVAAPVVAPVGDLRHVGLKQTQTQHIANKKIIT